MEEVLIGAAVAALGALSVWTAKSGKRRRGPSRPSSRPPRTGSSKREVEKSGRYPGDFTGRVVPSYNASLDGNPDPGEIVWTWVPYEDDHTKGKDRPVLLVGHDGEWLLGLMLTSKDHDRDAADEARYGRRWIDIGTGDWDRKRRPSEVRLDRIIRIHPDDVRREGALLPRGLFDDVVGSL